MNDLQLTYDNIRNNFLRDDYIFQRRRVPHINNKKSLGWVLKKPNSELVLTDVDFEKLLKQKKLFNEKEN